EMIPVRDAPGLDMPIRDHVVTPLQYPVEGASMGYQAFARIGVDQLIDQLVDDRVFQAHGVAAAGFVGTFGLPELALFVARRTGLREAADHHIEIPRAQAIDVLGNVDPTDHQIDPQIAEVALERQQYPLELG